MATPQCDCTKQYDEAKDPECFYTCMSQDLIIDSVKMADQIEHTFSQGGCDCDNPETDDCAAICDATEVSMQDVHSAQSKFKAAAVAMVKPIMKPIAAAGIEVPEAFKQDETKATACSEFLSAGGLFVTMVWILLAVLVSMALYKEYAKAEDSSKPNLWWAGMGALTFLTVGSALVAFFETLSCAIA